MQRHDEGPHKRDQMVGQRPASSHPPRLIGEFLNVLWTEMPVSPPGAGAPSPQQAFSPQALPLQSRQVSPAILVPSGQDQTHPTAGHCAVSFKHSVSWSSELASLYVPL